MIAYQLKDRQIVTFNKVASQSFERFAHNNGIKFKFNSATHDIDKFEIGNKDIIVYDNPLTRYVKGFIEDTLYETVIKNSLLHLKSDPSMTYILGLKDFIYNRTKGLTKFRLYAKGSHTYTMTENKKLMYNKEHTYIHVSNLHTLPGIVAKIENKDISDFPKIHVSNIEIKLLQNIIENIFSIDNRYHRFLTMYLKEDIEFIDLIQNNFKE